MKLSELVPGRCYKSVTRCDIIRFHGGYSSGGRNRSAYSYWQEGAQKWEKYLIGKINDENDFIEVPDPSLPAPTVVPPVQALWFVEAYDAYESSGGFADVKGTHTTLRDAAIAMFDLRKSYDFVHVVSFVPGAGDWEDCHHVLEFDMVLEMIADGVE